MTLPADFTAWTNTLTPDDRALVAAYGVAANAKQRVAEQLASGGRAIVYTTSFRALQAEAAKYPALDAQMAERGLRDKFWTFGVRTGFMEALVRDWGPLVLAAAAVASIGYSGALSSSTYGLGGATTATSTGAASLTTADTYAAMSQAAGLTTSGNIAADLSLASAVQTGTLSQAAAQAYASSIAGGAISAADVVAGLAADYGIGGTAVQFSVWDAARNLPTSTPNPADTGFLNQSVIDAAVNTGAGFAATALTGTLTPRPKAPAMAAPDTGASGSGTLLVAGAAVLAALFLLT